MRSANGCVLMRGDLGTDAEETHGRVGSERQSPAGNSGVNASEMALREQPTSELNQKTTQPVKVAGKKKSGSQSRSTSVSEEGQRPITPEREALTFAGKCCEAKKAPGGSLPLNLMHKCWADCTKWTFVQRHRRMVNGILI